MRGGFFSVGQDENTKALRPSIGYAIIQKYDIMEKTSATCDNGHPLELYEGVRSCDVCGPKNVNRTFQCRDCDYDMCIACARKHEKTL